MDAMTQMAATLGAIPQTKQERRAAVDRQNYRRRREALQWRWKLRRLAEVAQLITGDAHANH